jgi:hypothetical protein
MEGGGKFGENLGQYPASAIVSSAGMPESVIVPVFPVPVFCLAVAGYERANAQRAQAIAAASIAVAAPRNR